MRRRALRAQGPAALGLVAALAAGGLVAGAGPAAAEVQPRHTVVKLPITAFTQMVADPVRGTVWIAGAKGTWQDEPEPGRLLAYASSDGSPRAAYHLKADEVSGVAVDPSGEAVYSGEPSRIRRLEASSPGLGQVDLERDVCGRELAHVGGRLLFTQHTSGSGDCATAGTTLGVLTDEGWHDAGSAPGGRVHLEPGPGDRVLLAQARGEAEPDPVLAYHRVADGDVSPAVAERRFGGEGDAGLDFRDAAWSEDGGLLAVADARQGLRMLDAATLGDAATHYEGLPEGVGTTAVDLDPSGNLALGGAASGGTPDLTVQSWNPAWEGAPLEFAFEGTGTGDRVAPRGVRFSADGRDLHVVTTDAEGDEFWLHIVHAVHAVQQTGSAFVGGLTHRPGRVVAGEPVALHGRLDLGGSEPVETPRLTAVREDAGGRQRILGATVRDDGTFVVYDEPERAGRATYRITYAGDLRVRPAEDAVLTVDVARAASGISLTVPAEASRAAGVEITGVLRVGGVPLDDPAVLTVRATGRDGTVELAPVTVAADGSFTVRDTAPSRGNVTYTVGWPGDALHEGAEASATVRVRR
ncbi:Ig-like domain repeat protein [Streptomyces sp. NPDC047130]|uniref:Ig-like domain repeat protein n=1 Tax=Streptomyces sp. NPDC047130 TaxID=3155261 RepID=UPI0033E9CB74